MWIEEFGEIPHIVQLKEKWSTVCVDWGVRRDGELQVEVPQQLR
jgi:hypothetical protein